MDKTDTFQLYYLDILATLVVRPLCPGIVEEPLGLLAAAAVLDEGALVGPGLRHLRQVLVPLHRRLLERCREIVDYYDSKRKLNTIMSHSKYHK